jgi:hypothetical protein
MLLKVACRSAKERYTSIEVGKDHRSAKERYTSIEVGKDRRSAKERYTSIEDGNDCCSAKEHYISNRKDDVNKEERPREPCGKSIGIQP